VIDSFYLAIHYLLFHRLRSLTVVACIVLVAALPVALGRILEETEEQLMARAATTPLLLGAKGSSLDLVMSAVYFGGQTPDPISLAEVERIEETDLAYAIPVHTGFSARGAPSVGTTIDYLDFRELSIDAGRSFALLGESVLGAGVARRLGLAPGDSLVSSPESFFDLAGAYPLKTKVVGVLAPSGTPDDLAVFVDLKTGVSLAAPRLSSTRRSRTQIVTASTSTVSPRAIPWAPPSSSRTMSARALSSWGASSTGASMDSSCDPAPS
jgi:putative ABC transport system permease protein